LGKKRPWKYNVNHDFFEIIDNEEKAYWLGFLYADGSIRIYRAKDNRNDRYYSRSTLELGLASRDIKHLEKFRSAVAPENPILYQYNEDLNETRRIIINSHKLCADLVDKGCIPNKTLSLTFPDSLILPDELTRHFIRGFFDGDGSFCYVGEWDSPRLSFCGTRNMIDTIYDIFDLNYAKTFYRKVWYITVSDRDIIASIIKYMYNDSNIYLNRKKQKTNRFLGIV